jgi:uncharacterized membrane protein YhhN
VTAGAWLLLVLAAGFAAGDWVAVVQRSKPLEYVCKPLTIVLLIAVAASLDVAHESARTWFMVALFFSLAGDVFLMLPRDLFVPGLASFLVAHLAYVAGLWAEGVDPLQFVIGLAVVTLAIVAIGGRVVRGIRAGDEPSMATAVMAYMAVISLMLASAIGTGVALAAAGAALFYCSDALIAWQRFVRPRPWHGLAIIVTYHLGQAGLTLSLVT